MDTIQQQRHPFILVSANKKQYYPSAKAQINTYIRMQSSSEPHKQTARCLFYRCVGSQYRDPPGTRVLFTETAAAVEELHIRDTQDLSTSLRQKKIPILYTLYCVIRMGSRSSRRHICALGDLATLVSHMGLSISDLLLKSGLFLLSTQMFRTSQHLMIAKSGWMSRQESKSETEMLSVATACWMRGKPTKVDVKCHIPSKTPDQLLSKAALEYVRQSATLHCVDVHHQRSDRDCDRDQ